MTAQPRHPRYLLRPVLLLSTIFAVIAASSDIARAGNGIPLSDTYRNPGTKEVVEWLPQAPADRRIQYGPGPLQFGDLRLPDRHHSGGYPIAVYVHGGGWNSDWNMDHSTPFVEALTNAGVATWSIEYRRLGNNGGGWPGSFLDVGKALDHLRVLAPAYSLDLNRVVVIGHSAGGNFSHWLAGRHNIPTDSPLFVSNPLAVKGAVSLAGTLDLELRQEIGPPVILQLLGVETEAEAAPRYAAASPRHLLPMGIPQAVFIASMDPHYLITIAEVYTQAARDAGDHVEFLFLEGANHFDHIDPCGPAFPLIASAVFSLLDHNPPAGRVQNPGVCR